MYRWTLRPGRTVTGCKAEGSQWKSRGKKVFYCKSTVVFIQVINQSRASPHTMERDFPRLHRGACSSWSHGQHPSQEGHRRVAQWHETRLPSLFFVTLLKVTEFPTLTRIIKNRNGKGIQVKLPTNCSQYLWAPLYCTEKGIIYLIY